MPGNIVGKISLKVTPDTSDFRRELRRKLRPIQDQVEAYVTVKPDFNGFRTALAKEARDISLSNRKSDASKVKVYATLAADNIRQQASELSREYQRALDSSGSAKTEIATEVSHHSLRDMKKRLEDWRDKVSPLKVGIHTDINGAIARVTKAGLGALTRPRKVSIVPVLDNKAVAAVATSLAALSGLRVLKDTVVDFKNFAKELDRVAPKIAALGTVFANVASGALALSSNVFALSSGLAQMGAVALAAPGILGGMAVGITLTAVAFKDIFKVMPGVKKEFKSLGKVISNRFWETAKDPFQILANTVFPQLERSVGKTSSTLGSFFGTLALALKADLSGSIGVMFDNLDKSIVIALTGTRYFASTLKQLGLTGSEFLPRLAAWYVQIQKGVDGWLKSKGPAGLRAEFEAGLQAAKDFGGILLNTTTILMGVARAADAAGGSSLGTLRASLKSISDVVNGPAFQGGLIRTFTAAHAAMNNLLTSAAPGVKQFLISLADTFAKVLPRAGSILGLALDGIGQSLAQVSVRRGVINLLNGVHGAVVSLTPALKPLGQVLGSVLSLVGALAPVISRTLTAFLVPMSKLLTAVTPSISLLAQALGGVLVAAIDAVAPYINQLATWLQVNLPAAMAYLAPKIGALAGWLKTSIPAAIDFLVPKLASVWGWLKANVPAAIEFLVPKLAAITTWLGASIPAAIEFLVPRLAAITMWLGASIPAAIEFLNPKLASVTGWLRDSIPGAFGAIGSAISSAYTWFTKTLPDAFLRAWGAAKPLRDAFAELGKALYDLYIAVLPVVKAIGETLKVAIIALLPVLKLIAAGFVSSVIFVIKAAVVVVNLLTAAFQLIAPAILTMLGVVSKILPTIGKIITGVMGGTRVSVSGAFGAIGSIFSSTWNAALAVTVSALARIKAGVSAGVSRVTSTIGGLPRAVVNALGDFGHLLYGAGERLIQGLINGIGSKIGALQDKAGELAGAIKGFFPGSPIKVGPLKSWNNGGAGKRLVDQGIVSGLKASIGSVKVAMATVAAPIAAPVAAYSAPGPVTNNSSTSSQSTTLNYYAAPGASLGAEKDLFSAIRKVGKL